MKAQVALSVGSGAAALGSWFVVATELAQFGAAVVAIVAGLLSIIVAIRKLKK